MHRVKKTTSCAVRRAFTLTELAIFLLVVGGVMGGLWVAATSVWDSYQIGKTVLLTQETVRNIRGYYGALGQIKPYATINAFMIEMDDDDHRIFPPELRWDPTRSIAYRGVMATPLADIGVANPTPLQGTFLVERLSASSFRVSLLGMDVGACQKILLAFPVLMPEMGVTSVVTPNHTGGIAVDLTNIANPGSPAGILPFTPATAASECASASAQKDIRYAFKLSS